MKMATAMYLNITKLTGSWKMGQLPKSSTQEVQALARR
jgi:hypothetical protein